MHGQPQLNSNNLPEYRIPSFKVIALQKIFNIHFQSVFSKYYHSWPYFLFPFSTVSINRHEIPISSLKSDACKEGGAHFRISFWHLLMNLKNNYFLKELLKWVNKKRENFNIYHNVFFKKDKKTPRDISRLHLCTKSFNDMIYSSWYKEHDGLSLVILGQVLLFYPSKIPPKSKFWKKNCWRYHFTLVYQKP